jgi:indolepyruvate ferredoxin oxidoreductase alpha subunit
MGADTKILKLVDVARGLGIDKVVVVDPYDIEGTISAIRGILDYEGPSVIISKRACPLLVERGKPREVTEKCSDCEVCTKAFGCPAIYKVNGKVEVDASLCYGCGVCEVVCPADAIRRKE